MAGSAELETVLHGIPNCDTVKRARAWLDGHGVAYRFHDFKQHGVPPAALAGWIAEAGWERLLNRQGTTWCKLDESSKAAAVDAPGATALMLAQPSVIKRPVVRWSGGELTVGFDEGAYVGAYGRIGAPP